MILLFKWNLSIFVLAISAVFVFGQTISDSEIVKVNAEVSQAYSAKKYDDALLAVKKLIELTKQKYGKTDVAVARALKIKGRIEKAKGDWWAGVSSFKDAAEVFKKQPSLNKEDGNSFAGVLEAIADFQNGNLSEAEKNLRLALKWRESSNGADSPEVARTLGDLANVKFLGEDYKAASELNKQSLLMLVRNPVDWTRDLRVVTYYRTRCSFRKAKIEDQFETWKNEHKVQIGAYSKDIIDKIPKENVLNGKALSLGKPSYPFDADRLGISGIVKVETLIDEKGEVVAACATADSNKILALSAERAAYRSKFSPTVINGLTVKVEGLITFNFER